MCMWVLGRYQRTWLVSAGFVGRIEEWESNNWVTFFYGDSTEEKHTLNDKREVKSYLVSGIEQQSQIKYESCERDYWI